MHLMPYLSKWLSRFEMSVLFKYNINIIYCVKEHSRSPDLSIIERSKTAPTKQR